MSQKFQYFSTEELQALHGDDFLELVIATRARIQKMNPQNVAESIDRTLRCVLDFVSGTTRVPRSSTLSAMLKCITGFDGVGESATSPQSLSAGHKRREFSRKPRYVRPLRRSVARVQKRA